MIGGHIFMKGKKAIVIHGAKTVSSSSSAKKTGGCGCGKSIKKK
jgi:hypothetical protein